MPTQEFGFQAGNSRFKFMEIVTTANGVYLIFPIPEMKMHLSFHYPNKKHPNFGAFLRVPGLDNLSYTLELDEDILTVNNLLSKIESFGTLFETGYMALDDTDVMILPDSLLNNYSGSGRKNYFDMSNLMAWDWRIEKADQLPKLVSRTSPTVVGLSLETENTAIIFDRETGAFQLSLDDLTQMFDFNLLGNSFQRSLEDTLEEITAKRPDVLEKATPTDFIDEIKRMIASAGARANT